MEQCLTSLFLSSLFLHRKAETESGKFGDGKNLQWHHSRLVLLTRSTLLAEGILFDRLDLNIE